MKNPLLNVEEDTSVQPGQQIPFFEKVGIFSTLIISVFILLFSFISFYVDIMIKFNFLSMLFDLLIIIISMAGIYFIYNAFQRRFINEVLMDTAFQNGVYARLQPLIENIANTNVGSDIILERISNLDLKIQSILKVIYTRDMKLDDSMQEPVAVGTSLKFTIKTILLLIISMAAFMFLVNFTLGGITPYSILLIYVMWWVFITGEFNLWKENSAWIAVFLPILVTPVTFMLFQTLLTYNLTLAGMYISVGLFILLYYTWAVYATTGNLPLIMTKKEELLKQEQIENKFFSMQQRGMIRESLDAIFSRIEQKLREDEKKQESEYVWKK